jgi:protein-L-isoaspartate(D-aspartate) O-methyltransferase
VVVIFSDLPKYQGLRRKLVEHLRLQGITEERVLAAIGKVPRHLFLESGLWEHAYEDRALPIAGGQTISQPYTVAFQTQLLAVEPGCRVLEIGTGSGYQAAILAEMGAEVYSIERVRELYQRAKALLHGLGYSVHLRWGDGRLGWPTHAPYDRILLTAAAPEVPEPLLQQLAEGGRLVAPIGPPQAPQEMILLIKKDGQLHESRHGRFRFVPLQ